MAHVPKIMYLMFAKGMSGFMTNIVSYIYTFSRVWYCVYYALDTYM